MKHRYREPGTEQATGLLTREQESHAAIQIAQGLEAARSEKRPIDASTARLIAAALHSGHGSYLEQFASTGALNVAGAIDEIGGGGSVELHHIPWVSALWDFLEQTRRPDPDRAEVEHREPEPSVFVQAYDPDLGLRRIGAWVNPAVPAADLAEQMNAVAALTEVDGASTQVTATVGFHQIKMAPDTPPELLSRLAQNVAHYGEPYALYTEHLGFPATGRDFEQRFQGSFPSLTEFVAQHAVSDLIGPLGEKRPTSSLEQLESALLDAYIVLQGRDAVHVFLPGTPGEAC